MHHVTGTHDYAKYRLLNPQAKCSPVTLARRRKGNNIKTQLDEINSEDMGNKS